MSQQFSVSGRGGHSFGTFWRKPQREQDVVAHAEFGEDLTTLWYQSKAVGDQTVGSNNIGLLGF